MKFRHLGLVLVALLTLAISSCKKQKVKNLKDEVIANYVEIVYASYEDSYNEAAALHDAIDAMVANPSQTTFDAAQQAWLAAREPYGQTETYRFYDGPIDNADGPEGALNAWPLDENYIDYVRDGQGGFTYGGIIYDTVGYATIDATVLAAANEQGGEKNISIGYHAIEFLLWGQDFVDVNTNVGQGGDRSYTDYTSAQTMHERRAAYLQAVADQLLVDLASVRDEWAPNGSYRTTFLALEADEAIAKILTGAGILSKSELAGERIFVALEANSADNPQEDEHSCFADNTNRDVITNALGINNVLSGTYINVSGTVVGDTEKSILKLVELVDADESATLATVMADALAKVNAIPDPFDKTVTEENVADNGVILQAVNALQAQGDVIAQAATALGISISTELPE